MDLENFKINAKKIITYLEDKLVKHIDKGVRRKALDLKSKITQKISESNHSQQSDYQTLYDQIKGEASELRDLAKEMSVKHNLKKCILERYQSTLNKMAVELATQKAQTKVDLFLAEYKREASEIFKKYPLKLSEGSMDSEDNYEKNRIKLHKELVTLSGRLLIEYDLDDSIVSAHKRAFNAAIDAAMEGNASTSTSILSKRKKRTNEEETGDDCPAYAKAKTDSLQLDGENKHYINTKSVLKSAQMNYLTSLGRIINDSSATEETIEAFWEDYNKLSQDEIIAKYPEKTVFYSSEQYTKIQKEISKNFKTLAGKLLTKYEIFLIEDKEGRSHKISYNSYLNCCNDPYRYDYAGDTIGSPSIITASSSQQAINKRHKAVSFPSSSSSSRIDIITSEEFRTEANKIFESKIQKYKAKQAAKPIADRDLEKENTIIEKGRLYADHLIESILTSESTLDQNSVALYRERLKDQEMQNAFSATLPQSSNDDQVVVMDESGLNNQLLASTSIDQQQYIDQSMIVDIEDEDNFPEEPEEIDSSSNSMDFMVGNNNSSENIVMDSVEAEETIIETHKHDETNKHEFTRYVNSQVEKDAGLIYDCLKQAGVAAPFETTAAYINALKVTIKSSSDELSQDITEDNYGERISEFGAEYKKAIKNLVANLSRDLELGIKIEYSRDGKISGYKANAQSQSSTSSSSSSGAQNKLADGATSSNDDTKATKIIATKEEENDDSLMPKSEHLELFDELPEYIKENLKHVLQGTREYIDHIKNHKFTLKFDWSQGFKQQVDKSAPSSGAILQLDVNSKKAVAKVAESDSHKVFEYIIETPKFDLMQYFLQCIKNNGLPILLGGSGMDYTAFSGGKDLLGEYHPSHYHGIDVGN